MNVGFFGPPEAQRCYAHHVPSVLLARPRAVLICNPGPQEFRQAHFALRTLAERLAARGAHVLRFDYVGTGDSAGDPDIGSLDRWANDVSDAIDELRALAGVSRITVVGLRLGAAVACRAVARGARAHELVLWDPVLCGGRYLAQLEARQERIRLDLAYPISDVFDPDTLLGLRMSVSQRAELDALDLHREPPGDVSRVTIFSTAPDDDVDALCAAYQLDGASTSVHVLQDASLDGLRWHEDTLLARAIPAAIEAHVMGDGR
jgi:pimeloyl-ACP methyl ester carboxylesterase